MKRVNLYIETDNRALRRRRRRCGYVLECIIRKEAKTVEGFREGNGTYNQEILHTLIAALSRIREPCELCIYTKNRFILDMLQNRLKEWAETDFLHGGAPVRNREEWKSVWDLIKIHTVSTEPGKHLYSSWLLAEMEKHEEKKRKEHLAGPKE